MVSELTGTSQSSLAIFRFTVVGMCEHISSSTRSSAILHGRPRRQGSPHYYICFTSVGVVLSSMNKIVFKTLIKFDTRGTLIGVRKNKVVSEDNTDKAEPIRTVICSYINANVS